MRALTATETVGDSSAVSAKLRRAASLLPPLPSLTSPQRSARLGEPTSAAAKAPISCCCRLCCCSASTAPSAAKYSWRER